MDNNYENLANAIILQAAKDYRKALRTLSLNPHNRSAQYECRSIESFFRSGWFGLLTHLDPELLISKLKAEVEKLVQSGKISQQQLNQLQQAASQFQQLLG